ncbi:nucleotidyltransferase family protein [Ruminiclostridium herbifermentans]|uniref:Nucleotidyltransferase family protein n=1 Tax=Ruminiclostridium herbifermentans TaxID=2488810 RepID=A0A4U7JG48_9FIRM|nr:nucleotidyltransferase family protein [Ruminiclostridium herbifermentans]QNU66699.1 nucleotidyltransferase family protein [Ruminiclostridium herbifermentans]
MHREELSLERQLVLMTAVIVEESQSERLKEIVESEDLNWAEVIYQAITHRTLNMLYYNLDKYNLFALREPEFKRLCKSQWNVYGQRNKFYLDRLAEIMERFEKANLVVPILKGNLLASVVYPAIEARIFNDLDLIMQLSDVNVLTKELEALGYIQGEYDEKTNVITEASRKVKILQQMNSHEIQEFLKNSDNEFAKVIEVDVNHDILWKGNCPYKVDTRDLIKRAIPIEVNGVKAYMLDYIDNIIQLSCHLYKEATLMIYIDGIKDLKIYKFSDLYMYIKKFYDKIDWELLVERVKSYNLDKVVYYNFYYIELMFGEIIPSFVNDALKPDDLTYLDEYAVESQEPSIWQFDFFTRLFDVNRMLKVDKKQREKMEKFIDAKRNKFAD